MDGEEQLQRSDSDLATLLKGKAKAHFDPEGDGAGYVEQILCRDLPNSSHLVVSGNTSKS